MRYDAEHKQRTREMLLKEAARAIRSEGPQRVGVAAIMGKLKLTHGGFYAHFKSKDELIAQAIEAMFSETEQRLNKLLADKPAGEALAEYVDFYLSPRHRADRGRGCPIPALSAEVPHLTPHARRAFATGVAGIGRTLAGLLREIGDPQPRQSALSLVAELSGAVALARCMGEGEPSDALLAASRTAIAQRYQLTPRGD
jgi:TetR/AcrR family transcriptional repressor of nem operon